MEEKVKIKKEHVDKVFHLAKMSLALGRINRKTFYEDGIRRESDTDHTFMLGLIACSLAETFYKNKLNIGLISQYALIHDFVEVYAGDTDTVLNNSEELKKEKEHRENESFKKIKSEIEPEFYWATDLIEKYEKQEDKESRFVKFVDKILPEITHIFNNHAYDLHEDKDQSFFIEFRINKFARLKDLYGREFIEIVELYKYIHDENIRLYNN